MLDVTHMATGLTVGVKHQYTLVTAEQWLSKGSLQLYNKTKLLLMFFPLFFTCGDLDLILFYINIISSNFPLLGCYFLAHYKGQ